MAHHDDEEGAESLTSALGSVAPTSRSPALRRMVAQLVLDTATEGIWLIDAQARTTFVNRHAAELLGYTEEEMIGLHIFDLMDEERRPAAQQNLMRRQKGIEERQEVKLRRKDGSPIWVIGSTNPVYDREGRYAGALALLGDLSSQKQTEQRLRAEVESLKAKLASASAAQSQARRPDSESSPRAPVGLLRGAGVVALCGTYLGLAALLTAGGVMRALLGPASSPVRPPEY
jgi:PAS domain S-box-containing protein